MRTDTRPWHLVTIEILLFGSLSCLFFTIKQVNGQTGENAVMQDSSISTDNSYKSHKPSLKAVVGYSILCVTVTNMAALIGLVFSPLKKYRFYGALLSFMVATAVGSLLSSATLVLIPESLKLSEVDTSFHSSKTWFVSRAATICVGTLTFYILEFFLRRIPSLLEKKQRTYDGDSSATNGNTASELARNNNNRHHHHGHSHFPFKQDSNPISTETLPNGLGDGVFPNEVTIPIDQVCKTEDERIIVSFTDELKIASNTEDKINTCSSRLCTLEPIVWMILVGDGMHNFMDGLSIGAGFTQNARVGFSITLAVLCEELPHELGDIAVLLTSGLSIRMAILFNFLSACTAYLGMIVGILVGELAESGGYIFALTAGFFLYISLADMVPEMRKMEEAFEAENRSIWCIFVVHLCGLLFGFSCILTVTMTSQYISL